MQGFYSISKPLLFNPMKHHLGYIHDFVENWNSKNFLMLKSKLSIIGNSQMDLYCGCLSLQDVCRQIIIFINDSYIANKLSYSEYILEYNGFKKVIFTDGSEWILKIGKDIERYVHFHPGRGSTNTIRIKANTLKSVVASRIVHGTKVGLAEINQVRSEFLDLDPLNSFDSNCGLGESLTLFP